jgi:hypothetical protein
MIEKLKSLHACWNLTTGQEVNYRATERIWFELANLDFTEGDLLSVLKHVLQYNKTHGNCPMKVQVHKLCGDVEVFGSICAEAKARERNKVAKPTPRESVLQSFRGITPEPKGNAVPVKMIFEKLREATQ